MVRAGGFDRSALRSRRTTGRSARARSGPPDTGAGLRESPAASVLHGLLPSTAVATINNHSRYRALRISTRGASSCRPQGPLTRRWPPRRRQTRTLLGRWSLAAGGALKSDARRREVFGLVFLGARGSRRAGRPGGAGDEGGHQPGQHECEVHGTGVLPGRVGPMRPATAGCRECWAGAPRRSARATYGPRTGRRTTLPASARPPPGAHVVASSLPQLRSSDGRRHCEAVHPLRPAPWGASQRSRPPDRGGHRSGIWPRRAGWGRLRACRAQSARRRRGRADGGCPDGGSPKYRGSPENADRSPSFTFRRAVSLASVRRSRISLALSRSCSRMSFPMCSSTWGRRVDSDAMMRLFLRGYGLLLGLRLHSCAMRLPARSMPATQAARHSIRPIRRPRRRTRPETDRLHVFCPPWPRPALAATTPHRRSWQAS